MKLQTVSGLFWVFCVLHMANGQSTVAPGPDCWYSYKCEPDGLDSFQVLADSDIITDPSDPSYDDGNLNTAPKVCRKRCEDDSNCEHFTHTNIRDKDTCYYLTDCPESARSYDDKCLARGKCSSGPKDCTTEVPDAKCATITADNTPAGTIHWQCVNKEGVSVNGYQVAEIEPETTCSLRCESWKDKQGNAGYLQSTCKDDGNWEPTIASGDPANPELKYPTANDEGLSGTYPTPATVSILECGCEPLEVRWQPNNKTGFYYDPNLEAGTDFICDDPIAAHDGSGTYIIKTGNTCNLFCDDHLVANVQCVNGEWTGEPDLGFWCYTEPKVEDKLTTTTASPGGGGGTF